MLAVDVLRAAGFDVSYETGSGYGPLISKEVFRGRKRLGVMLIAEPTGEAIEMDQDASVPMIAQFYPGEDFENGDVNNMFTYGGDEIGLPVVPLLLLIVAYVPEFADCTPTAIPV